MGCASVSLPGQDPRREEIWFPSLRNIKAEVLVGLGAVRPTVTSEDLESLEFPYVKPRLRPLLHVVCLIWATCESYRCPGRLTVLLQEICNLLVQQVGAQQSPALPRGLGGPSLKKSRVCICFFRAVMRAHRVLLWWLRW